MRISGLQKLTLLDYPGHVACTLFTAGCNFRCPFCHNSGLVLPERAADELDEDFILSFLKKRQGILDGVAITGGEPLLHKDMPQFLSKIKALGYKVKLDSNGSYPDLLEEIIKNALVDRVAMDIKNSPESYSAAIGIEKPDMKAIERSKNLLLRGSMEYEFRTTVVKGIHTAESIRGAAEWITGAKEYYLQQFKDSGDIINIEGLSAFNEEEMRSLAGVASEFVPSVQVRGI